MIDATVQEKNIRFPTDSQLQNQSRKQLVTLAHELGISLRQTYQKQASYATTLRECFVVGARSFAVNPYDGHTLSEQLEQVKALCNDKPIDEAYADRGYRGSGYEGDATIIIAG